ncbi:MAG: GNAT family N-acetyltransferase [Acholeplasmataceae bacterium]|jgi:ribosomal-protein-alanine N-acetyltransferase|nr:GNAT family N-acetyltransferase [Acholeplasmataceae bacterium]
MIIRKSTLEDLDYIYKLGKENLETQFSKETLKTFIIYDETYYVCSILEKDLIGYIILWKSDNYGQIIDIVIEEKYRKKGYGFKLLNYGINYLKGLNVNVVSLEVNVNNKAALSLYKKAGFTKERTLENYYENSDGVLLIRRLDL